MSSDCNLESISTFISRGIAPKYTETSENSILVINQKCIRDFQVTLEQARLNDLSKQKVTSDKLLQKFDVLVNSTGVGTLGRVAQYFGEKNSATVDSHVTIVRPDISKVDPLFFGYLIKNKQSEIEGFAQGTTGQTELSRESLKSLNLRLLDDLKKQKFVGNCLKALDDKIELNNQINQTLEAMAQAIFKSWFVDFEPVKAKMAVLQAGGSQAEAELAAMMAISGKTAEQLSTMRTTKAEAYQQLTQTAALFPAAMQESELGEIPEGWRNGVVGEISNVKAGYAFKGEWFVSEGNAVVKIKNITGNGDVDVGDCQYINDSIAQKASKFKLNDGDLLMAMTGATVAKTGILVTEGRNVYLNQRVAKFESEKFGSKIAWFLYCCFERDNIFDLIVGAAQGSAQPNISSSGIEATSITLPNDALIHTFCDKTNSLFQEWMSNKCQNSKLKEIRDSLLPKLLSGEIDISDMREVV